jgi:hypothetical protein
MISIMIAVKFFSLLNGGSVMAQPNGFSRDAKNLNSQNLIIPDL